MSFLFRRKGPESNAKEQGTARKDLLVCSFCGKNAHQVRKLIAGPKVFICNECIDLCNDIIAEEVDDEGPLREPSENSDQDLDDLAWRVAKWKILPAYIAQVRWLIDELRKSRELALRLTAGAGVSGERPKLRAKE